MSNKKRKSIKLHLLEGNPNRLTKAEIEQRQKHEEAMKAGTDKIIPPDRLTKKQKERFNELASELVSLGIFDNLDVDTLALYVETYDNYVRVLRSSKRITNQQMDADFDAYAKRMRTLNQLVDTCRKLANDLGLTITSRLKLVIPQKEEEEESPMAKFLSRRGAHGSS